MKAKEAKAYEAILEFLRTFQEFLGFCSSIPEIVLLSCVALVATQIRLPTIIQHCVFCFLRFYDSLSGTE